MARGLLLGAGLPVLPSVLFGTALVPLHRVTTFLEGILEHAQSCFDGSVGPSFLHFHLLCRERFCVFLSVRRLPARRRHPPLPSGRSRNADRLWSLSFILSMSISSTPAMRQALYGSLGIWQQM